LRHLPARAGGERGRRECLPAAAPGVRARAGAPCGGGRAADGRRRFPVAAAAPRRGRRLRRAPAAVALMRFRRHIPAAPRWQWTWPSLGPNGFRRWALALGGAVLAGYLTAYLVVFPSPIWRSRQVVPRVLGLALEDASRQLRQAGFQIQDGGAAARPRSPCPTCSGCRRRTPARGWSSRACSSAP